MKSFLSKSSLFFFLMLFSVNLYSAEEFVGNTNSKDFTAVNLKAFYGYINADAPYLKDKNHYFYEIETIARNGKWDLYGFTDLKFVDGQVDYDFFKYIVKYDVLDNSKLFIVAEAKETFAGQKSNTFIGLGTSFNIPLIGSVSVNAMYYTGKEDANNMKLELPFMLQLSWFNELAKIGNTGLTLYHGGWSDVDFFEKRKDGNSDVGGNKYAFQIFEAVGVNYKSYATEIGYKYWQGMGGSNYNANSVFVYLIKRF